MDYIRVRDIATKNAYYIKSKELYNSVKVGGLKTLPPTAVYTAYPSLEHDRYSRTLHGDQLELLDSGYIDLGKDYKDCLDVISEGVEPKEVAVNFDDHYKKAKGDKLPEPIEILSAVEVRLLLTELGDTAEGINAVCNIVRGLKYILRSGFKEGEDVAKEVHKFYNYTHRARTGKWIGEK
jgi:hypothetical protein